MHTVSDGSSNKSKIAEIFLIYSLWFFVHSLVILSFFYFDLFSKVPLREDIQQYLTYANLVLAGFPEKSFPLVYPPIAMLLFTFTRLFTPMLVNYQRVFFLIMMVFDFLSFSVVVRVAGRTYASNKLWRPLVPLIYMMFLLFIGHLIYFRYDLAPAFLVLLALFFFQARSPLLTWLALALAVATKGFAIVIVPVFLIFLFREPILKTVKGFTLFLAGIGFFTYLITS
ncbi:MAG: hypothetical protein QMD08_06965 [Actinomycetota bacterium]|nr:hypothetical protein [Actinomycetota bacterium]